MGQWASVDTWVCRHDSEVTAQEGQKAASLEPSDGATLQPEGTFTA